MAVVAGERRIVTVLFADIVGSTAIAETLGPERFSLLVDEVLRVMSRHVERFDGTVVQFIGDELYAVFGAPRSHEDDSERAVRAALAIQRALGQYAGEVGEAYGVDLSVRIAINTGPVVIRPESDDPYNALGDTVNVAARIQELVEGGEIVVGRSTKLQVDNSFSFEELGEHELRGISGPVATYRVVGYVDEPRHEPEYPLVGRDFELSVLERSMDALAEGRGTIVTIVGEPGIGKSRLAAEIRDGYADRIRFVEGRSVSYAQNIPYWPVRDLLREWLGVDAATPEARVRLELKAELAQLLADDAESAYPFVASLLGIGLEPDAAQRVRDLSRESLQRETFESFTELVCRLAREASLCLVLEDLHWADDSTLELLENLLTVTDEAAVGLVFLYRAERDHGSWRLGERARQRHPHRYRELELRPLADDASRALAVRVAGAELPDSVAELLTVRAGGNPFFLEEALHDLVERGALQRTNGRLVLAVDIDELAVPTLVQGALQARLDRLEPETREAIGVAAVAGRTFGLPLLEQILPHEQVARALSELQRLDLVVERRRRPAPEYGFRHGLVQEVAYASLVEGKRRRLHLKVGEAIEALSVASPESSYGLLARHFAEADVPDKAADYLLLAGDAARALYADQEALEYYGKARTFLARLGDERRARDTLFKMALSHHLAFDFQRAEDAYDEAFSCRPPASSRLDRTERIETAMDHKFAELVPGGAYTTEGAMLLEHLFRGLLTVDHELNVLPAMADNFRVSGDGLTYLFRIRENMRWSDGAPVTADDFAYGWRRMREEEAVTGFLLEDVEATEVLDDRTLEVRVSEPRSYFPYLLASPWAFPWPRHVCERLGDEWRKPENLVCNGPFALAELTEEHARLTHNAHWLGPHGNVSELEVALGLSNTELLDAWQEGRFDVLQVFDSSLEDAEDTLSDVVGSFGTHYVGFRSTEHPFCNELVRKAFGQALDRAKLLPPTALARAAVRGGVIPLAMPGHSHRVAAEFDLEAARQLLADAGYPGGQGLPVLEFRVPTWLEPDRFVEQWAQLGARVNAERMRMHEHACDPEDAHLWVSGWWADYPDPDGFFRGLVRGRSSVSIDDDVSELVAEARSLRDQGARMQMYHDIDRKLVAERALLQPLFYTRGMMIRRPRIENVWANPMTGPHLDQAVVTRSAPRRA
jgi:class 3 adenylate cyclase/ABC-type oligopeptide transport system substrate-binding subunit